MIYDNKTCRLIVGQVRKPLHPSLSTRELNWLTARNLIAFLHTYLLANLVADSMYTSDSLKTPPPPRQECALASNQYASSIAWNVLMRAEEPPPILADRAINDVQLFG